jgi:alkylhydroperoxidase family enzyme
VSERHIAELADYATSDAFSDLQRLALDYATALTQTPANATDELVENLRKHLDEKQLVELTTMIAWENFRARFNRGFDVAPQGFSEGASCPIPACPS